MNANMQFFLLPLTTALLISAIPATQAAKCHPQRSMDATISPQAGFLSVLIYFVEPKPVAAADTVRQVLAKTLPSAKIAERLQSDGVPPAEIQVTSRLVNDVQKDFPPPSLQVLSYFGRGLTREQAKALTGAKSAHTLKIALPQRDFWKQFRMAHDAVHAIAVATGGLIWDDETREAFSASSWKERRMDTWTNDVPLLERHYTIHLYRQSEHLRAITLGMGKFGLPDIVIQALSQSDNNSAATLINLLAKRLSEQPAAIRGGAFDLKLADIRDAGYRNRVQAGYQPDATGEAPLCLYRAKPEQGDPNNTLFEIAFDRAEGRDAHAKRFALLSRTFGALQDPIRRASGDDEALLQASKKARAELPRLKVLFGKGLAPGEKLLLKVAFSPPLRSNVEYMWVEVSRWDSNGAISGLLLNEPRTVKNLQFGQIVRFEEAKVYDYMHTTPDGRTEGNETSRILEERARRK